jgi:NADPH-dependent 2,4-dienoyl-CoA reductase/sulfur reductase-like enzyme
VSVRFDVLVVGAGPGGIAAATIAAEAGCRVCLLDDNAAPGGQIWRGFHAETAGKSPHGNQFLHWTTRLRETKCEIWKGWQAIDAPRSGTLRLERSGAIRDIEFGKLILATGARERFLPFPGWTLPGVMGVGGVQAMVKSGLNPTGKRVVLAGSGPLLLAVGASMQAAGAKLAGIFEQASFARLAGLTASLLAHPSKLVEGVQYRLKTRRVAYRTHSWVVRAEGQGRVESVTLTNGHKHWSVDCDWLGCGFHLVPNLELPLLLGCLVDRGIVEVDQLQQASVPGVFCVGELTGIGGLEKALVEGQVAGWAAAGRTREAFALEPQRRRQQSFVHLLDRAFTLRPELRVLSEASTLICRCEDVPFHVLEHCSSWRQAKLHTRCGMGACQGRVCGPATEFLFGWNCKGWDATEMNHPRARPPVFPAQVSTLAAPAEAENQQVRAD